MSKPDSTNAQPRDAPQDVPVGAALSHRSHVVITARRRPGSSRVHRASCDASSTPSKIREAARHSNVSLGLAITSFELWPRRRWGVESREGVCDPRRPPRTERARSAPPRGGNPPDDPQDRQALEEAFRLLGLLA